MSRSIWSKVFTNFVNSLRPRQAKGNLMGEDYMNNKYFEIPADPRRGKRNPSRWFEPIEKDNFEQELPAEWEAWLRGRRKEIPSTEEVLKNLGIMQMKKTNAKKVAIENPFVHEESQVNPNEHKFPVISEYELPDQIIKKK
ncbi:hypothetical protein DAPPUDRAFT_303452 [Daphnia pulex]|uniref:Mimitin, mitochondrial n=1 Tax=Daphnia pulex TaxID=6669 RepID=E9GG48_DAPPU|nr:hypothetical protein DAPPUDRAFT_303452 [Daphnia pulex]|eukprot:EFX81556.1 hypothetical protein DAPPUDRAFT_303452 [Daphnia pulex]